MTVFLILLWKILKRPNMRVFYSFRWPYMGFLIFNICTELSGPQQQQKQKQLLHNFKNQPAFNIWFISKFSYRQKCSSFGTGRINPSSGSILSEVRHEIVCMSYSDLTTQIRILRKKVHKTRHLQVFKNHRTSTFVTFRSFLDQCQQAWIKYLFFLKKFTFWG